MARIGTEPSKIELTSRGRRRTWVEQLKLPMAEKFLLRVLEGHARDGGSCGLKAKTVAHEMGCSTRTVYRTTNECVRLGLIRFDGTKNPDGASEYEILWKGVGLRLLSDEETRSVVSPEEAAMLRASDTATCDKVSDVGKAVTSDTVSGVDSPTRDKSSGVGQGERYDTVSGTCDNLSETYDKLSGGSDTVSHVNTVYPRERGRPRSLNHDKKPCIKPCADADDSPQESNEVAAATGGWGRSLTIADFRGRESINRLWDAATKFKYVENRQDVRVKFFATAKQVERCHRLPSSNRGHIRNPGAFFTDAVMNRRWSEDTEDIRAAVMAIAALDNGRTVHR